MSDGISEAHREQRLATTVMLAANDLAAALLATEDRAFFKVHPSAVNIANAELQRAGYQLVASEQRKYAPPKQCPHRGQLGQ